jgi:hypothetical protein
VPDSFGKRQRDQVKARKAAARDERRVARNKRRKGLPTAPPGSIESELGWEAQSDPAPADAAPVDSEPQDAQRN